MRNIIAIILCVLLAPWGVGFSQDNIYGDYLIYSLEKNVSLDLESAQLVDVLKMLSQQTKLNFISTEAVRDRELTLYMENVPLKEAMNIIFKANGLAYDFYPDSNIFVVKEMGKPTLELKTKIYRLQYVWLASSNMDGEIADQLEPEDEDEDEDGEAGGIGIRFAVERVLSPAGRVTEDPASNSLIVVDVPSQFPMIDEVVAALDIPAQRVLIEAEMLDVSKSHLDKLGFNWANGLTGSYIGPNRTTAFPLSYPGESLNLLPENAPFFNFGTLSLTNLSVVMEFLTQDKSTKFLARPKILTLANETAEVNITTDAAIGVTTTVAGETGATTEDIERETIGTRLRVTPQVNPVTNEITLFVEVFNRDTKSADLTLSQTTGVKDVEERSARSVVRLQEGETLYIGGLISKQDQETITKVPILGDIPFVGALFRHKSKPLDENTDRELMIFLTPHIIEDKPYLAKKRTILSREQVNYSKRDSVNLALDSFSR